MIIFLIKKGIATKNPSPIKYQIALGLLISFACMIFHMGFIASNKRGAADSFKVTAYTTSIHNIAYG